MNVLSHHPVECYLGISDCDGISTGAKLSGWNFENSNHPVVSCEKVFSFGHCADAPVFDGGWVDGFGCRFAGPNARKHSCHEHHAVLDGTAGDFPGRLWFSVERHGYFGGYQPQFFGVPV